MNEERRQWVTDFKAFAVAGFPWSRFNAKIYQPLSNMFGHIAHYNSRGFWTTWFSTPEAQLAWLIRIRDREIYGDPSYCWSDVEAEIKTWVQTSGIQARVKATVPDRRPRVVIICDGGLVQEVVSELGIRVTVVDLDVDTDEEAVVIDGSRVAADVRVPEPEVDAAKVEAILSSYERQ